ncbi:MAG: manganese efflux pump [Clostridia bacterium]|nr:manganese efflux pump [Clostridia bacterium]
MSFMELLITAIGLSMDAFAVAVCKGLSTERVKPKHYILIGLWFGGFQGLMPLIGYLLGSTFESYITPVDHWVAFVLLGIIGGNMLKEGLSKDDCDCKKEDSSFAIKTMFLMALATSIDALAVGITFALLPDVSIVTAVTSIGVITFVLSAIGLKIGNVFGTKYKSRAEITGGIILILMGTKILLEHLGVLNF